MFRPFFGFFHFLWSNLGSSTPMSDREAAQSLGEEYMWLGVQKRFQKMLDAFSSVNEAISLYTMKNRFFAQDPEFLRDSVENLLIEFMYLQWCVYSTDRGFEWYDSLAHANGYETRIFDTTRSELVLLSQALAQFNPEDPMILVVAAKNTLRAFAPRVEAVDQLISFE